MNTNETWENSEKSKLRFPNNSQNSYVPFSRLLWYHKDVKTHCRLKMTVTKAGGENTNAVNIVSIPSSMKRNRKFKVFPARNNLFSAKFQWNFTPHLFLTQIST